MIKIGILFTLVSAAAAAASSWVEVLKSEEVDVNKRRTSMRNLFHLFDVSELGSNFTGNLLLMSNINSTYGSGYVIGKFSNDVGQMVCQEMGYKRMKGTPRRNTIIHGSLLPFTAYADGIECGVGPSGSLIDFDSSCISYRATREEPGDAIFLDCEERLEEAGYPELLLVNFDKKEPNVDSIQESGVLVVKWSYNGETRAATVNHYTHKSWDEADLICRKMGYSIAYENFGEELPALLENLDTLMRIEVNCLGNETDIFDCPIELSNSTDHWAVVYLGCKEDEQSENRVQPDAFHLMQFPESSTLNGGLVLAEINETLSTICLEVQPDYDQFCSGNSSGSAVPAEWYFNRTDLEQFPTLSQRARDNDGNDGNGDEFYRNLDGSCNEGNRLAVICTETLYYVGVYNPETQEVNSNEGIVIVSAVTDGNMDMEAIEHGIVHYSRASSADQEMICITLGFPGVAKSGPVPDDNEHYQKFNEAFNKHVADYAVERLGCPAGASYIADCNLNLVAVDVGDIQDTLVIKCNGGDNRTTPHTPVPITTTPFPTPEPTPEPTPRPEPNNTKIYLHLWNPVTDSPNEGIVVVEMTNRNTKVYGLLDWVDVAIFGEYEEIICNTLGFSGVVKSLPIEEYKGLNEENIEDMKNWTDFIVDELRCPTGARNISDCDPKLVEPAAWRIAEDSLVIICESKPTPSPKPVPYTTSFPFTTPEPFTSPGPSPTSDNEVDLDFGGLNLKLILGRHRYRERF